MRLAGEVDVAGRSVLCCGAAPASLALITALLAGGARVRVVADEVPTTVRDLAARAAVDWQRRSWSPADLAGVDLVVAATGSDTGNAAVTAAAASAGRLCLVTEGHGPASGAGDRGEVILVGGGPGDPGLMTLAGLEALRTADVVVCDRLAPLALLAEVPAGAEIIDVAKIPRGEFTSQERINDVLIRQARQGRRVVRLKGGDGFVFGRGGEEWQACAAAGLPVRVIPGVTSAVAAPELAGIPLTHRQLTQGFTVVSGHLPPGDPGSTLDWPALARVNTTLVIMMGVATLPAITAELVRNGLESTTPAVTVASAGLPGQRTVRGTVASIAHLTAEADIEPPAVTVIGAVAGFSPNG